MKLSRATGNALYLEMARRFLEAFANGDLGTLDELLVIIQRVGKHRHA